MKTFMKKATFLVALSLLFATSYQNNLNAMFNVGKIKGMIQEQIKNVLANMGVSPETLQRKLNIIPRLKEAKFLLTEALNDLKNKDPEAAKAKLEYLKSMFTEFIPQAATAETEEYVAETPTTEKPIFRPPSISEAKAEGTAAFQRVKQAQDVKEKATAATQAAKGFLSKYVRKPTTSEMSSIQKEGTAAFQQIKEAQGFKGKATAATQAGKKFMGKFFGGQQKQQQQPQQ